MKKLFTLFFATLCMVACEKTTPDNTTITPVYVDLGLASGTEWKSTNEMNPNDTKGFYDHAAAMTQFEANLPTQKQWAELRNSCTWTWIGEGYKVVGPNGNSIILPAAGYRSCSGIVGKEGMDGGYWSSTFRDEENVWSLYFNNNGDIFIHYDVRCFGRSVRLIHSKTEE